MAKYINKKGEYGIVLNLLDFLDCYDRPDCNIKEETVLDAMDENFIKTILRYRELADVNTFHDKVDEFRTFLHQTFGNRFDMQRFKDYNMSFWHFDITYLKPKKPFMIVWNSEYDQYELFQEKTFTVE